ncbi:52 kDa repressor of the inhibitor of the protein kinase-like, partial [Aphis craccivora]
MADETTDVSKQEQMSLCIRYIDPDLTYPLIQEDFLKVYDGATSMSGHLNGAQAVIRKKYPKALFVHCSAHSLNLAINDACKITVVRNTMGSVSSVCNFFRGSAQRTYVLKNHVINHFPSIRHTVLLSIPKPPPKIFPIYAHGTSLSLTYDDAQPVYLKPWLEDLQKSINTETSNKAYQLLSVILNGQFFITLSIIEKVFAYTLPLCYHLQAVNSDLTAACDHVQNIIDALSNLRENSDSNFKLIYDKCNQILIDVGSEVTIPRCVKKQTNRDNTPSKSPEEYYRRTIFNSFLDRTIVHLSDHFKKHKQIITDLEKLIPSRINPDSTVFNEKFCTWKLKWLKYNIDKKPSNAVESLLECNKRFFPNIRKLLEILATLPLSTATAERTFSTLRRLKTYLRNTTGEDRLTGLALLLKQKEINVDPYEV